MGNKLNYFYGILCKFGWKPSLPEFIVEHTEFMQLFDKVKSRALLGIERAFLLYQFAKQAKNVFGDVVEVGVYRGGGAMLIADAMKGSDKAIHLFDTFEGMPEVDSKEDNTNYMKKGLYADTNLNEVKNFLSEFKGIEFYKGFFPKTAQPIVNKKFCFVHIDTDIYQSTKACLEFFYNKMNPKGIIVCDDYGNPDVKGVKKAVDGFFENKKEFPINSTQYQCVIIKL